MTNPHPATAYGPAVSRLLEGIRVLDLSIWRPGPYASQLLVEMGAEVIKVEPPGGDPMRAFPDLFADLNAGKRSVALDLKEPAGREAVHELAREADVFLEGFRPGVAERLGVGSDALLKLSPRLVYCSISGYGQTGPLAATPGHDINYQAWAGTLEPPASGEPPVLARPPIADLAGGAYAVMAVNAALVRRARTGEGATIDVAMTDVLASWTGGVPPVTLSDGRSLGGQVAGYGLFRTGDGGWVSLGVLTEDHLWSALADALGLDDVAALAFGERVDRGHELQDRLTEAIAGHDRDTLVATLLAAGVPAAPALSQAEMLTADPLRERGVVLDGPAVGHPVRVDGIAPARPATIPPLVEGADHLPSWT